MKWFASSFLSQEQTWAPAMSNVGFIKINLEEAAAESGVESVMNRRRKYEKKNKALEDDHQGQAELSEQK